MFGICPLIFLSLQPGASAADLRYNVYCVAYYLARWRIFSSNKGPNRKMKTMRRRKIEKKYLREEEKQTIQNFPDLLTYIMGNIQKRKNTILQKLEDLKAFHKS